MLQRPCYLTLCLAFCLCSLSVGCGGGSEKSASTNPTPTPTVTVSPTPAPTPTPGISTTKDLVMVGNGPVGAGGYGIIVTNTKTRASQIIASGTNAAWSPNAKKVAISSYVPGWLGVKQVSVANPDGSNFVQITTGTTDTAVYSWSPDSTQVAVAQRPQSGPPRLAIVNADGSGIKDITPDGGPFDITSVAWSPRSNRLAFFQNNQLSFINADGSGFQTLTSPGAGYLAQEVSGDGAWSPDGTAFVFASDTSPQQIYKVQSDLTGLVAVTTGNILSSDPAWSRDGNLIAFRRYIGGTNYIWVAKPDGSGLKQLAKGSQPSWSIDNRIAFCAPNTAGATHLAVINADGSNRIDFDIPCTTSPAWSPK